MRFFPHVIRLLIGAGHSPNKALELVIDASREDCKARRWIGICFARRKTANDAGSA